MKKNILVGVWDATQTNDNNITWIYHTTNQKQAIINFLYQYFKHDYNTFNYPDDIAGIYKSKVIKDRYLYNVTDNIIIYAQIA